MLRAGALRRDREFLKLWSGQTISQVGSWITRDGLQYTAVLMLHAAYARVPTLQTNPTRDEPEPTARYGFRSMRSRTEPSSARASMWAVLPVTFTDTKCSVLMTFWVMPAGGLSTSYSGAPPPPVIT